MSDIFIWINKSKQIAGYMVVYHFDRTKFEMHISSLINKWLIDDPMLVEYVTKINSF